MANREKKLSINRKQIMSSSPVPSPKENQQQQQSTSDNLAEQKPATTTLSDNDNIPPSSATTDNTSDDILDIIPCTPALTPPKKVVVSKPMRKLTTRKTPVAPKLKTKVATKSIKVKQQKLAAKKNVDTKKKLIKNCVKRIRKPKQNVDDDLPPVLEPMCEIIHPEIVKKPVKKRVGRPPGSANKSKKPKVVGSNNKRQQGAMQEKSTTTADTETVDDVINDLTLLIKNNDIKKDSEPSRSYPIKREKMTMQRRLELMKEQLYKKEDIENTFDKLNPTATIQQDKPMERIDFNVDKIKKDGDGDKLVPRRHSIEKFPLSENLDTTTSIDLKCNNDAIVKKSESSKINLPIKREKSAIQRRLDIAKYKRKNTENKKDDNLPMKQRRRHSIEKFPLGENSDRTSIELTIFNNLPRSISPRSKQRVSKLRQSVDGFNRRLSPYTTRSDSPARILRNGKHRKLDLGLLDGLDNMHKRRRRHCSDFSGSEISKNSGYESDSSFSDLSSIHGGAENFDSQTNKVDDQNKTELLLTNGPIINALDTNSNLCNTIVKSHHPASDNNDKIDEDINISGSPSLKVPEKSIILDIMKQTFNNVTPVDTNIESATIKTSPIPLKDDEAVPATIFYGAAKSLDEPKSNDLIENITKDGFSDEFVTQTDDNQLIVVVPQPHDNQEEEEKPPQIIDDTAGIVVEMKLDEIATTSTINAVEEPQEVIVEPLNNNAAIDIPLKTDDDGENGNNMVVPEVNIEEPPTIEETPENLAIKENILQALGLQSLKAAEEAKKRVVEKHLNKPDNNYTGTLKTVIKINRERKKGRNPLKMTLQKNKNNKYYDAMKMNDGYKIMQGASTSQWKQGGQSSDTAGAQRKSHYSNRSNMDGSSEHTSDGEGVPPEGGQIKALVIPEKASSFSIHPGRLCKDECSYCFGKFGLFDTPCHIAQMKSVDRQDKILAAEKHLTRDSCLCDACYRHVDRKSNTPSYTNKSYKRSAMVAPGPRQDHCHVLGCDKIASNILRRKWIIKMRKSICQVINIDLDNPGLHSIPICEDHYFSLEHLMVCAMCKRRLARNHVHYLGPETVDLNIALNAEGIPLTLTDKPVVCKLCKCFATVMLKAPDERPENSSNFFLEYKKRLLHFNDIVPMDEAAAEEPIAVPSKDREQIKRKKKLTNKQLLLDTNAAASTTTSTITTNNNNSVEVAHHHQLVDSIEKIVPSSDSTNHSRSESPSDYMIDYNTLIPSIALECGSDDNEPSSRKEQYIQQQQQQLSPPAPAPQQQLATKKSTLLKKMSRPETVKEAVEISKNIKLKTKHHDTIAVQKLGSNPSISVRQLFPCEEDLPLLAQIDFGNVKERTAEGWEKCTSIIQYDRETKHLWHDLQKPYGNQSSFLRHLILLEKYFRNGDLVLSANASHHSMNYSESVQNRLKAYDNMPSGLSSFSSLSSTSLISNNNNNSVQSIINNNMYSGGSFLNKPQKSNSGIITSTNLGENNKDVAVVAAATTATTTTTTSTGLTIPPMVINAANFPKNIPLTLAQLNSPPLLSINKNKSVGAPPGLISLHPGTSRPVAPLVKVPQSTKIKFPITKNWRPNLIPIDPTKKMTDRKTGLVQVISGGKPYHITLEDYRKMLAIKKSFDLKQKRLQEATNMNAKMMMNKCNSMLKTMSPRNKGLVISKTSKCNSSSNRDNIISSNTSEIENSLEKLDQQVEKLETKFNEKSSPPSASSSPVSSRLISEKSSSLVLPKIPKSLTVIPQTVTRKPSRPTSPVLLITQKSKSITVNHQKSS